MEGPWNIPQIWKWVEIKALGDIVSGGTPSTKEMSYWGDDVNWISPADLTGYTKKTIARGAKNLTHKGLAKSSARLMPAGSIHFSSRAPIGYVAISSEPLSTNQGFKSLVPAQGVFNEYVYYYLKAAKYIAEERASGTTFREISGTAFGKLPLPFPPLPEQHRIVAKIEELFSELDNGIESLKKAREQLKTYRQAVLKYAFEGKLTKEWRTQHLPAGRQGQAENPPEPAEKLLEKIKTEREKHYQKQLEDWKRACEQAKTEGKKKPTKPKKLDFYPALTKKEILDLPLLPHSWCWEKIGNLCQSIVPNRDKPKTFTGNIPWLTTPDLDLQKITVNLNLINKRLSKEEINKYNARLIPENSVIMTCVGTFGVTCINNQECVINQQLHAFITHQFINSRYIAYALKFKEKYMEQNSTSTTISYLNKTKCNSLPIPICAIDEQKAIVEEIESRLSVCDNMEQTIEDSLKKGEALRQSILKKAFEGELTRDWREKHPELITGENSAEKLLERIKAEKALAARRKKPRSKKMKKK